MENTTALPVVSDCMTQEHDGLYVAAMVVLTAIWTLVAMLLRKRQNNDERALAGEEMV